ncbi:MAG TPA: hypothetical protein VM489_10255 [Burkholderiales bacterium]|nr:hypothetical protein [Burkholderiales bacterium]
MISLDLAVFLAVLAAFVLALAWFVALPEWRRLQASQSLELWRFLRRAPGDERDAELRCAACAAAPECARRLAAGETTPVEHCPNAELFRRGA